MHKKLIRRLASRLKRAAASAALGAHSLTSTLHLTSPPVPDFLSTRSLILSPTLIHLTIAAMFSHLPDELILAVAAYVCTDDVVLTDACAYIDYSDDGEDDCIPGYGRKCLRALSLTDRRTRAVSLELLLADPIVELVDIPSLILTYLRYPDLAFKTRSLGLKRDMKTLHGISQARPVVGIDEAFVQVCKTAIWNSPTTDLLDKGTWIYELRAGQKNALLAVLFALLPNLEELNVWNNSLHDFAIFSLLFGPPSWSPASTWYEPPHWRCEYLQKVFAPHFTSIRSLELPGLWYTYDDQWEELPPDQIPVRTLHVFSSLQHLVAPEGALVDAIMDTERDPSAVLPHTLESITLTDVEVDSSLIHPPQSWNLLRRILEQKSQQPSRFPTLQHMALHYRKRIAQLYSPYNLTLQGLQDFSNGQEELWQLGKQHGVELEFGEAYLDLGW